MKITEQNWREELIKENAKSFMRHHCEGYSIGDMVSIDAINKVIQSLITSIKQEERERIEKLKIPISSECDYNNHNAKFECCRNMTIDTILQSLTEEDGKEKSV